MKTISKGGSFLTFCGHLHDFVLLNLNVGVGNRPEGVGIETQGCFFVGQ